MAVTLAQAQQLSQSKLTNYIIDEFRKSALLDSIPFDNTIKPQGKTLAYVYNRVTTQPTAAFRAINSEYTPQESATSQVTVNLKVFGGSFQIDRVLAADEEQVVDLVDFQTKQKIKATRALFHDTFINGDSSQNANAFDGIDKAITGSSTEITPGSAIVIDTSAHIDSNWKVFLDALRDLRAAMDGAPTLYLMNSDMYSKFQSVMDRAGINLASKTNYGDEVSQWGPSLVMALGDKPGTSNPIIPISSKKTCIYAVRLDLDGVHGVSPSGSPLINTYLPDMHAPGAVKTAEVEMVAAIALKATKSAAVLRNIQIVA